MEALAMSVRQAVEPPLQQRGYSRGLELNLGLDAFLVDEQRDDLDRSSKRQKTGGDDMPRTSAQ
eukprot:7506397-Prorocentrum_lima.AAC.1